MTSISVQISPCRRSDRLIDRGNFSPLASNSAANATLLLTATPRLWSNSCSNFSLLHEAVQGGWTILPPKSCARRRHLTENTAGYANPTPRAEFPERQVGNKRVMSRALRVRAKNLLRCCAQPPPCHRLRQGAIFLVGPIRCYQKVKRSPSFPLMVLFSQP